MPFRYHVNYWTQRSANSGLVEGIKFFFPGDGPVTVEFHGDGGRREWNGVLGMGKWGRWAEPL